MSFEWFLHQFAAYRLLVDRCHGLESAIRELGVDKSRLQDDLLYWREKWESTDKELKELLRQQIPGFQTSNGSSPQLPAEPVYTNVPIRRLVAQQNRRAIQDVESALQSQLFPNPDEGEVVSYDANI